MIRRACAAGVLLVAAACGSSGEDSSLRGVDDTLDDITAATIDFEVSGSAGDSEPVGFRLRGPFSFEGDGDYPEFDFTYTRLLAGDDQEARVSSDGSAVFVTDGTGARVAVPSEELDGLRLKDGEGEGESGAGLERLRVSEWVDDPETIEADGVSVTTGKVDLAECFADLAAMARQLGVPDAAQVDELAGEDEDRLRRLVRSSSIRVESDPASDRLRLLELSVDLAPRDNDVVETTLDVRLALSDR